MGGRGRERGRGRGGSCRGGHTTEEGRLVLELSDLMPADRRGSEKYIHYLERLYLPCAHTYTPHTGTDACKTTRHSILAQTRVRRCEYGRGRKSR